MSDTLDLFAAGPAPKPAPATHTAFAWWTSRNHPGAEVAACAACNVVLRRPIGADQPAEEYGTAGFGNVRPCPGRNALNPWARP